MNPTTIAAWLAVIGTAAGLFFQGYNVFKNRRRERFEIQEALDRAPLVREQLELGNVGEAVKQLNLIIERQAQFIIDQDARHKAREAELQQEIDSLRQEVQELKVQRNS